LGPRAIIAIDKDTAALLNPKMPIASLHSFYAARVAPPLTGAPGRRHLPILWFLLPRFGYNQPGFP
jgi:hypothetical protein